MFSNAKKFFKKNMLLTGIVVFVILIVGYFLFMYNSQEGFYSTTIYQPLERQRLVKVSTLEKFYNRLTDPVDKDIVAPMLEIYKLIVSNYDNAFNTALLIYDANNEMNSVAEKIPDAQPPPDNYGLSYNMYEGFSSDSTLYEQNDIQLQPYQSEFVYNDESPAVVLTGKEANDYYASVNGGNQWSDIDMKQAQNEYDSRMNKQREDEAMREKAQNDYYVRRDEVNRLREKAKNDVRRTWSSRIDPGITALITNVIRWLPTGKPFYDKLVLNNFYGLRENNMNPTISDDAESRKQRLLQALVNTLYEDDQLSIVLGPSYAKSQNLAQPLNALGLEREIFGTFPIPQQPPSYMTKLTDPFIMIALYAGQSGNLLPDIIVNMISQLNSALANDITDQATIGQLNSKLKNSLANDITDQATIGQLNSKLKNSLANDATDQATITNLQSMLKNLQSQQKLAGQSNVTPAPAPVPIKPVPVPTKRVPVPIRRLW